MNMILITLGYNAKLVLPDDVDSGVVIAALARAQLVESHGYGAEEKFTAQESEFGVRKILASKLVLDEEGTASVKLEAAQRSLESTQKSWLASMERVKELEKKLAEQSAA